jgi:hypothetical protein
MVRIGENDLRMRGAQLLRRQSFYRSARTDRHERRRFDRTVRQAQRSAPRGGIGLL